MSNAVLLASNNAGKLERFRMLVAAAGLDVELKTPAECGIEEVAVVENGASLAENAEIKARAYFGKTDLPILANDTGFWVDGEGLVEAPKREALQGESESELSVEEVGERLIVFWKQKATDHGGQVDAAWIEAFALLVPDGSLGTADSRRDVTLTNEAVGTPHVQFPIRALYIAKATGKRPIDYTREDELKEMQPLMEALKELLSLND